MNNIVFGIFIVIGAAVAIAGGILGWAVFPTMITDKIKESTELKKGTDQYKRFEELPIEFNFNIRIFNITNEEEIRNGEQPEVVETGSYRYLQHRKKQIINQTEDGSLEYTEQQTYEHNTDTNKDLFQTELKVLNPALNAAAQLVKNNFTAQLFNEYYNETFGTEHPHPFLMISVDNYLFNGYNMCKGNSNLLCIFLLLKLKDNLRNMRLEEDGSLTFSFFNHKNVSHDGYYSITDGIKNIDSLGWINTWQNEPYLKKMWVGDKSSCNKVGGRDSVLYAPFMKKTPVKIFSTDICRTVDLEFKEEIEYKNIPAYKFTVTEKVLDAPNEEMDTMCYCLNKTHGMNNQGCFKKGIMDLYNCYGAPIVLSWPHFLWADDEYRCSTKGMNPDKNKHLTYLEVEPNTGTPLKGARRIQMNMFLEPVEGVEIFQSFTPSILPILWIEEEIEISDDLLETLNESYISKVNLVDYVKWGLIGAGIVILVVVIAVRIFTRSSSKEHV